MEHIKLRVRVTEIICYSETNTLHNDVLTPKGSMLKSMHVHTNVAFPCWKNKSLWCLRLCFDFTKTGHGKCDCVCDPERIRMWLWGCFLAEKHHSDPSKARFTIGSLNSIHKVLHIHHPVNVRPEFRDYIHLQHNTLRC